MTEWNENRDVGVELAIFICLKNYDVLEHLKNNIQTDLQK